MISPANIPEKPNKQNQLRQLGRTELLEMMLAQSRINEQLSRRVEKLEAQLEDRTLRISKAGSMAEAALALNGVFEAAEAAYQQYVQNIQRMDEHQTRLSREISQRMEESVGQREEEIRQQCEKMQEDTRRECEEMREAARLECEQLREATRRECEEKQRMASQVAEEKWTEISGRLLDLYATHQGLQTLVEQMFHLNPPEQGAANG